MALALTRNRRKRLSMTSLIDVIFLLLLFFMLTSTFSKFTEIELTAATPGASGAADRDRLFLSLEENRLLLNGRVVPLADLPATLPQQPQDTKPLVLISLSADASAQRLVDILTQLRRLNLSAQVLE
ncbi:ExbD/TolR family protein [Epibacterium ulvae]|uniref:ExbD/TolR family protein n=1 Tax=Epibacterium ulvae TaxID=1156985 RepID=UPI0024926D6B|nr:biopolymer transporter ExbD [Epibacterium ulvae]